MILHKYDSNNVTVIQNRFIDEYMISANGEFVKVYLYLLRCSNADLELSLSAIADALNHTEGDIHRALTYWEKCHLLRLAFDDSHNLTDIAFTEPNQFEAQSQERVAQYAASLSARTEDSAGLSANTSTLSAASVQIHADRKKELAEMEEVKQLLFIAEQYLGKQLSSTEVNHILYFYDELKLSSDVIEYLIEYCVSKGKKSINYIRKVAFEWAQRGVKTVEEAKQDSNLFHKDYYTILKAFGIQGRGPAANEISYMSNWIDVLGFTTDIILEACGRTIARTHNPNFPYTDTILQDWHKKGVHHLADIARLDKAPAVAKSTSATTKNSANSGMLLHDYDYDELEKMLLDYE